MAPSFDGHRRAAGDTATHACRWWSSPTSPPALRARCFTAAGLLLQFDAVFGADEAELRKPAPALLHAGGARQAGVDCSALLMVGDGPADLLARRRRAARLRWSAWGYGGAALPDGRRALAHRTPALCCMRWQRAARAIKAAHAASNATPGEPHAHRRQVHADAVPDRGTPPPPGRHRRLNALITDVSLACKAISRKVALRRAGRRARQRRRAINVQGEEQKTLDVVSNDIFLRANEWGGHRRRHGVGGAGRRRTRCPRSTRAASTCCCSTRSTARRTSTSTSSVGSIFSILRAPDAGAGREAPSDFLQPGTRAGLRRLCDLRPVDDAGADAWATASHAFTLDPHARRVRADATRHLQIPSRHARVRDQRVEQPLLGAGRSSAMSTSAWPAQTGPRGNDFNMRWIASLVAETHRILMRGGVFLYPRDTKDPAQAGPPAPAVRGQPDRAS